MQRLIEIRSYQLKPGSAAQFHALMIDKSLPMLREGGADVVASGPSAHERDTYFLIRSYADLADRNACQDAFYGSPAWREGPREAILALIETHLNTLLWLSPGAIEELRLLNADSISSNDRGTFP